jgi:hypothetical protein
MIPAHLTARRNSAALGEKVTNEEFRGQIARALQEHAKLGELQQILRDFAASGGERTIAERIVEELRGSAEDGRQEDLLLELLDIVTGWCDPTKRIW